MSMFAKSLKPDNRPLAATSADTSLAFLRLVNGSIFIAHGWEKMTDLTAFKVGLAELGVPAAAVFSPAVAIVEVVGGACLILGIFCRLAALLHAITMVVALLIVHTPWLYGLTGDRGMQFPLALLANSLVIVGTGGGAYSLSSLLVHHSLSPSQTPVQLDSGYNALSLRWWFGTILIATSCAYLLSPQTSPVVTAQVETTHITNIGREVLRAEQTTWERFQNRNIEGMLEMMDADFTAFSGSMPLRLDTKKAEEDHIRTFVEKLDGQVLDYQIREPRVQVFGQAAVLTYHFSVTVVLKGEKQTLTGKNTSVWVRRDKGWRQAHYHYAYNPTK